MSPSAAGSTAGSALCCCVSKWNPKCVWMWCWQVALPNGNVSLATSWDVTAFPKHKLWHAEEISQGAKGLLRVFVNVWKGEERCYRGEKCSPGVWRRRTVVIYWLTHFAGPDQEWCLQIAFRLTLAGSDARQCSSCRRGFALPTENSFNLNKREIRSCSSSTAKHAPGAFPSDDLLAGEVD